MNNSITTFETDAQVANILLQAGRMVDVIYLRLTFSEMLAIR